MSGPLSVADITSYLADNGWRRQAESWRGAATWSNGGDHNVLVPARDGMGDSELRVREIVDVLTAVEQRPREEIARDISSPLVDTQSYRTLPDGLPSGLTSLTDGLRALQGVRDLFDAATRVVLEGPHFVFPATPSMRSTSC